MFNFATYCHSSQITVVTQTMLLVRLESIVQSYISSFFHGSELECAFSFKAAAWNVAVMAHFEP